jgi:hypothetical protein
MGKKKKHKKKKGHNKTVNTVIKAKKKIKSTGLTTIEFNSLCERISLTSNMATIVKW